MRLVGEEHHLAAEGLPHDVLVYEVAGALFFGAAQKAMGALQRVLTGISVVMLDLSAVPAIDATGLVSLEAALGRLHALHVFVVLAGVQEQPARALAKAGIRDLPGRLAVCRSTAEAAELARRHSGTFSASSPPGRDRPRPTGTAGSQAHASPPRRGATPPARRS